MAIRHAILGLLSWQPSTGYELKKRFEESSSMYWSGNNNQIYRSLAALLKEGMVEAQTLRPEGGPAKIRYTLTAKGDSALRQWLRKPEPPEIRKPFLAQLAWADLLDDRQLGETLDRYEQEIRSQLHTVQEQATQQHSPNRTERERYLWGKIVDNLLRSLEQEAEWVAGIRRELIERVRQRMNYRLVGNERLWYVEFLSGSAPLRSTRDALDLASLCRENNTRFLLIHSEAMEEEFFQLRSGLAQPMLHTLAMEGIYTAILTPRNVSARPLFRELAIELNRGEQGRVFETREAAQNWFQSIGVHQKVASF